MNWYKKSHLKKEASVSFVIEDYYKIAQPKTVLDISNDLNYFFFKQLKKMNIKPIRAYIKTVTIDGLTSANDTTGLINIYPPENVTEDIVKNIIEEFNKDNYGKIFLKYLGTEISGMSKHRKKELLVSRIYVVKNNTTEIASIPKMNVSNRNAYVLLKLLKDKGLSSITEHDLDELGGTIDTEEYKRIRGSISEYDLIESSIEDKTGDNYINFGLPPEQIKNYLIRLDEIVSYIDMNKLPIKKISFG